LLGLLLYVAPSAVAQETVLNVPSADVLDKGKTYFEWDATVDDHAPAASWTPRMMQGIGHGVETGLNVSSFNFPTSGSVALVPTVKWKFYDNSRNGLALFAGENLTLPIRQRTFTLGSSVYLAAAKSFRTGTRVSAGAYDFTAHVVDRANRGGMQASLEQGLTPRLAAAVDWYSGNSSVGMTTAGISYKVTGSFTLYTAYELGNAGLMKGNHAVLLEIGWNPAWGAHPSR